MICDMSHLHSQIQDKIEKTFVRSKYFDNFPWCSRASELYQDGLFQDSSLSHYLIYLHDRFASILVVSYVPLPVEHMHTHILICFFKSSISIRAAFIAFCLWVKGN